MTPPLFHCKDELFTVMEAFAKDRGFDTLVYGVNVDDQGDFRPGQVQRPTQSRSAFAGRRPHQSRHSRIVEVADLRIWTSQLAVLVPHRVRSPVTASALSVERGEDACGSSGSGSAACAHGEMRALRSPETKCMRLDPQMAAEFNRIFKALVSSLSRSTSKASARDHECLLPPHNLAGPAASATSGGPVPPPVTDSRPRPYEIIKHPHVQAFLLISCRHVSFLPDHFLGCSAQLAPTDLSQRIERHCGQSTTFPKRSKSSFPR